MPGIINTLKTYPTFDFTLTQSPAQGMAFNADGNIYLAVSNTTFLALDKATGAVVFATNASDRQAKTTHIDSNGTFLNSIGGGAPHFTIAQFDGAGNLLANPASGPNAYGAIWVPTGPALYFAGNTGDNFVTVLNPDGSPNTQINTGVTAPTNNVGQWAFDPITGKIWCSAINSFLIEIDSAAAALNSVTDMTLQGVGRIAGLVFIAGFLYLSDRVSGNIWKVDPATNLVVASFFAGFGGYLTFDGTYLWMLDAITGFAAVFDFPAVTLQASLNIPNASDLAFDPVDGPGIVWVTSGAAILDSVVMQLRFIPVVPPVATGGFHGTFTAFRSPTGSIGGTK